MQSHDKMPGYDGGEGGGGMSVAKVAIIALVVSLVVVFAMNMLGFLGVSPKTYNEFVEYVQTEYALKSEAPTGPVGPQGLIGATGATGPSGAIGATGVGVESANINPEGHLMITLTSGSVIDAGYIGGGTTPPPVTGQVTVEVISGLPNPFTTPAGVQWTFYPNPVIRITNGTNGIRYVGFSLYLTPMTVADLDITDDIGNVIDDETSLSIVGAPQFTFGISATPNVDAATMLAFSWIGSKIALASGESIDMTLVLSLRTVAQTTWSYVLVPIATILP